MKDFTVKKRQNHVDDGLSGVVILSVAQTYHIYLLGTERNIPLI